MRSVIYNDVLYIPMIANGKNIIGDGMVPITKTDPKYDYWYEKAKKFEDLKRIKSLYNVESVVIKSILNKAEWEVYFKTLTSKKEKDFAKFIYSYFQDQKDAVLKTLSNKMKSFAKGGPGSGNFGHVGRLGVVGGSGEGGGSAAARPLGRRRIRPVRLQDLKPDPTLQSEKIGSMISLDIPASEVRAKILEMNKTIDKKFEDLVNRELLVFGEVARKKEEERKLGKYRNDPYWREKLTSNPEYQKLINKFDDIESERSKLLDERHVIISDLLAQPSEDQADLYVNMFYKVSPSQKQWCEKVLANANSIINKSVVSDGLVTINLEKPNYRGNYDEDFKIIHTPKDRDTLIHEFGHHIDENNLNVQNACIDFRNRRTEGEQTVKLKDLAFNSSYDDDEITKKDKFFSSYVGKIYKDNSNEILSMGLEKLMRSPVDFLNRDPEHFDLIVDIIKGKYNTKK